MKEFADLLRNLDRNTKTLEKIKALKTYFSNASEEDKIWALALFTGRRPPRKIKTAQVREWAREKAGIPEWLFAESYQHVGDLAETVALILPQHNSISQKSLHEWFAELETLKKADDETKKAYILQAWAGLSGFELFVFNKLLMGSLRVGVSQTLVIRALSELYDQEPSGMAHQLMGQWNPFEIRFEELIIQENTAQHPSKPYPFFLAYPIENQVQESITPQEWFVEWKWDGIRSQIIFREGQVFIWSRGEELVSDKFPELHQLAQYFPEGTVLDGEILCYADGHPLPFSTLQQRIGRKNITKKILQEAPVLFMAYDVLEWNGIDIREKPHEYRRSVLESYGAKFKNDSIFKVSPIVSWNTMDDLSLLHNESRTHYAEGFMLKRKSAAYQTGRKKGDWYKWKVKPLSVDAVLVYAQKGHGRRAGLFTDYTFAVWNGEHLVPFAKAYSGLTDKEIRELDAFIKQNTVEKFGPVRTVNPLRVFEIGFEGIQQSSRHKSGIAVRFPRILRPRPDKYAHEADTLENLQNLLTVYGV